MAERSFLPDLGQTTYTRLRGGARMPTSHRAEQERKKKPAPYREMADANIPYLPGPNPYLPGPL